VRCGGRDHKEIKGKSMVVSHAHSIPTNFLKRNLFSISAVIYHMLKGSFLSSLDVAGQKKILTTLFELSIVIIYFNYTEILFFLSQKKDIHFQVICDGFFVASRFVKKRIHIMRYETK
jgi:hypothetical protein